MKYLKLAAFSTFFFCNIASSSSIYDGIWLLDNVGYVSMHEKEGNLIAVVLDTEINDDGDYTWEAYWGPLAGNKLTLTTLIANVAAEIVVTFESQTSLKWILNACTPVAADSDCDIPIGTEFSGQKIW